MIDRVDTLVELIRRERLLTPQQLAELTPQVLSQFDHPRALAKSLVQSGWLTVYQINHLFEGREQELVLGPYCIVDRLGEGGMGSVYKAVDSRSDRMVALKVLREDLRAEDDAVRQFLREKEALTRLSHPNIIRTYDAEQAGSTRYFAMEYVEGTDLNKLVQLSGPLPIADACEFIRQVASGLQHAHQYGLVHRDIKPANLFLLHSPGQDRPAPGASWKRSADPTIKIIDWGLARLQDAGQDGAAGAPGLSEAEKGMLIGTADYVAPEQADDPRLVDIRADIYSLGCTFYYLLSGQPPFPGGSLIQKLTQHRQAEPRPIRELRPDVPEELANILSKMLAKQRENRYQIPLGVSVPLRRFCQDAGANGTNGRNGQAPKPASGPRPVVSAPPSGYFKRST